MCRSSLRGWSKHGGRLKVMIELAKENIAWIDQSFMGSE